MEFSISLKKSCMLQLSKKRNQKRSLRQNRRKRKKRKRKNNLVSTKPSRPMFHQFLIHKAAEGETGQTVF